MFKLQTSTGIIVKSYDVEELVDFIEENKGETYQFFHNYRPLSHREFAKAFLDQSKDIDRYIRLESLIYPRLDLIDYATRTENI
tara:strand:+ start:17464 stop:17715 length:252 start_codon:yes stop_codon:yes gene_type:complete